MRFKEAASINLTTSKPLLKWLLLAASIIIGAGSIIYTNELVKRIREREHNQVDLYAKTLEYLANGQEAPNIIFILEEIVNSNNTIPVILTDQYYNPEDYRNIPAASDLTDPDKRIQFLREQVEDMRLEREPIVVTLQDENKQIYGFKYIFYRNSNLLVQLRYYPYVQLSIIAIFVIITLVIFNYSRLAEQNLVWVGLAKETAHQLGTPLSSLMAWVEYFKTSGAANEELITELNKDVERLMMITERFSSIGSKPQLKKENIVALVQEVVKYLKTRISKRVEVTMEVLNHETIQVEINHSLFAWVIENLIKNAVDAMGGIGSIHIKIMKVNEGKVALDISDTGKGMAKNLINQVFNPGFTTKKRGWGLGLTLTRRIIENYHGGKIMVHKTEVSKGTTFRILLKT